MLALTFVILFTEHWKLSFTFIFFLCLILIILKNFSQCIFLL